MGSLLQDLRYGIRRLGHNPGSSLVIVLTLGLCIGVTLSLFSVARGVFLDPFPYTAHERIILLGLNLPSLGRETLEFSVPEVTELREQRNVFERYVLCAGRDVTLTGNDRPERVQGMAMSAMGWEMLGVPPLLGRAFTEEEDRPSGPPVVVISHDLWGSRFGRDPQVVGKTLEIEGEDFTVLGVMPQRFMWWDSKVWFPIRADFSQADRAERNLVFMARLAPNLPKERAEAELAGLARRWEAEHRGAHPEYVGSAFVVQPLLEQVVRNVRPALLTLLGAVICLFLIACANVGNLLLSQAVAREREIAIRSAIGADGFRITRQLMVEILLLSIVAAVLGFALAFWGTDLIVGLIPYGFIPAEVVIRLDASAFLFALGSGVLGGLLFGLAPVLHLSRFNVVPALKEGRGTRGGSLATRAARRLLVVAEVALALAIVVGAGIMIRSFLKLTAIEPGFNPENAISMRIDLHPNRYDEPPKVLAFYTTLQERIRQLRGVVSSGLTVTLPLSGGVMLPFTIDGHSAADVGAPPEAQYSVVTPGYFEAAQVPLHRGRYFTEQDREDSQPVAIINETLARRYFGDSNPIGKRLKRGAPEQTEYPWANIVGVVADIKQDGLDQETRQAYFLPLRQAAVKPRNMALVIRTSIPSESIVAAVRREVEAIDSEQPVFQVQTMEELLRNSLGGRPLALVLLSILAGLALVLAALGIFAVVAHSVSQRTQEIGVRIALGAQERTIFGLVLGEAVRLAAIGVAFGLAGAWAGSRLLGSLVYGIEARDPATLIGTAALFTLVAVVASYLPARRAMRVDPTTVLREQ